MLKGLSVILETIRIKFRRFTSWVRTHIGGHVVLCDSCKFNYRGACEKPERPNALVCEDYVKKY